MSCNLRRLDQVFLPHAPTLYFITPRHREMTGFFFLSATKCGTVYDFFKSFDSDSLLCYTQSCESWFFGHFSTRIPKTLRKQEFFAKFSGNRVTTHNPKDCGRQKSQIYRFLYEPQLVKLTAAQKSDHRILSIKTAAGLSQRSLDSYERILEQWADYTGDRKVSQFTDHDINEYIVYTRTEYVPRRFDGDTHTSPQVAAN